MEIGDNKKYELLEGYWFHNISKLEMIDGQQLETNDEALFTSEIGCKANFRRDPISAHETADDKQARTTASKFCQIRRG